MQFYFILWNVRSEGEICQRDCDFEMYLTSTRETIPINDAIRFDRLPSW